MLTKETLKFLKSLIDWGALDPFKVLRLNFLSQIRHTQRAEQFVFQPDKNDKIV